MNSQIKKIMVVDDEASILLSLSHALRADGVEVTACDGIEEAEHHLSKSKFDLVIADIRMSGVNGIEGLELLTYIKNLYPAEVIIMTGYGNDEVEAEAYRRGALHYFMKPIDIMELKKVVESIGIPVKKPAL